MARDFDLGIMGSPLFVSMGFIARGLVQLVSGATAAIVLFAFSWWAPLVLGGARASTHWLLRESGVWKDRNTDPVRNAQRHADYAYRLAVDPPAAKEVRLFGLGDWVINRFVERRQQLFELQWEATKLRERSVLSSVTVVTVANGLVFWRLTDGLLDGSLDLGRAAVFLVAAIGTSSIAFGGLSWALDASSAPAVAVERLGPAMGPAGALVLLGCFALPVVGTATWRRPAVERRVEERVAAHNRLARHLFVTGSSAGPAKEIRLSGLAGKLRASAKRRGSSGTGPRWSPRWRPPPGARWPGQCSPSPTSAPSCSSPPTPRPRSVRSCWSWRPEAGYRPTWPPPFPSWASSGGSGSTPPAGSAGWNGSPPPSARRPMVRPRTGSSAGSPLSMSRSPTPAHARARRRLGRSAGRWGDRHRRGKRGGQDDHGQAARHIYSWSASTGTTAKNNVHIYY